MPHVVTTGGSSAKSAKGVVPVGMSVRGKTISATFLKARERDGIAISKMRQRDK